VGGEILRTCPDRSFVPPSLLYNGYPVCFPEVKLPGRGVDHPPPSHPKVKERVELYHYYYYYYYYYYSGLSWPALG